MLIIEDSSKVTKRNIQIPKAAQKTMNALSQVYEPYLDTVEGGHVMKSYASDKAYNQKKPSNSVNNGKKGGNSVNVNLAKVRLHRQDKFPKDSIQYQLYGGDLMHNILKNGVEQARSVEKVSPIKPEKPNAAKDTKPIDATKDSKLNVNEGIYDEYSDDEFEHVYYKYMRDYNQYKMLMDFYRDGMKGKMSWAPLIKPEMYAKALREFTRFGKLISFPKKYVYVWMGIIMRNTAKLESNTCLMGHSEYSIDASEIEDFLADTNLLNGKVFYVDGDSLVYELSLDEVIQKLKDENIINEPLNANDFSTLQPYIEEYNKKNEYNFTSITYKHEKFWYNRDLLAFICDDLHFDDWAVFPDGTLGLSDYGIEPLQEIINEYSQDMNAEDVLVLVNRALDVTHQRGDLPSIFIEGGERTLSRISEEKKKVIIPQSKLKLIKEIYQ